MFRVFDTILSDDIATAKFACDVTRCKGACCVVGEAGAPVSTAEIPILRKAWKLLKNELPENVQAKVNRDGLIVGDENEGYQINCIDTGECVFVQYDENRIAHCSIQKAFYQGRFNWEKPVSCHLYPLRLKKVAGMEYVNFEYIDWLCGAGCENGEEKGVHLSDFLESALVRRYGQGWYDEFLRQCEEIRMAEHA